MAPTLRVGVAPPDSWRGVARRGAERREPNGSLAWTTTNTGAVRGDLAPREGAMCYVDSHHSS
jgi:hypothetical protein